MGVVAVAAMGLLAACTTLLPLQEGPHPAPDETVLAQGDGWILSVGDPMFESDTPTLKFHKENSSAGVSGYAQPPTLDEAEAFFLEREDRRLTVVAGPVDDAAAEVVVELPDESTVSAQLTVARGMTWFWIVLPGRAEIARISVRGQDGTIRDERTVGPYPLSMAGGVATGL